MDFHIYHHLGADEMKLLLQNNKALSEVNDRLKNIQETLKIMTEAEKKLNDRLDESDRAREASQQRALDAIATANEAIAVVQKQNETLTALVEELKANAPDLTDEIERVEAQIADSEAFLEANPPIESPAQPAESIETTE